MYEPRMGPLPGGLYEIDSDSELSQRKYAGTYLFDYDRTGTRTNEGVDVIKDYSCKGCGKGFKTLNELGTHTHKEHPAVYLTSDEPEPEMCPERTCPDCGKVLRTPYGVRLHREKAHGIMRKAA